jgi:hypothetical protein
MSLKLSLLKLIENMANCNYDFTNVAPELGTALETHGNKNSDDIRDSIRHDISLSKNINAYLGGKNQSKKHLLIVSVGGEVKYYWYQIHTEFLPGPPVRYSPYTRNMGHSPTFMWVLNVIEATNENCRHERFMNRVCRPSMTLPSNLTDILNDNCPEGFRSACNGSPHMIFKTSVKERKNGSENE